MIRKKWITSINKINLCNHIGSLCTDGAPVLREVRFYNSSEQSGTTHHLYSLCSSSIWTGKKSLSRILENIYETCNWTCEFYQATGLSFQTVFKDELICLQCLSMLYSKFKSCNCDFSKFWCGLGEQFSTLSKRLFEVIIPFQDAYLSYLCEAGFSSKTIKRNSDLDWSQRWHESITFNHCSQNVRYCT